MPPRDGSTSVARRLSGKHRLHPLAILFPLNSYSRPPRLGRSIRIPRWVGLSILFVVILIVDYYSDSVSVLDDGGVIVQQDEFTSVHLSVLLVGIVIVATLLFVRWWSFRWWIEDDAIWTSGGIFNQWRRRVTFSHIVTVDRLSTPVRRVFGASRIAIETTAVNQAAPDVLFGYLSNKNANLLEDLLITELEDATGEIGGLGLIDRVRAAVPSVRPIVLSTRQDTQVIDAALAAGAAAYVVKTAHPDDLASAVRQAFSHSVYVAGGRRDLALAPAVEAAAAVDESPGLTRRELEILRLVAEGHSNAQLARMLWVTEQTVKFHLSNIYRKLEVANRTEASRWAQLNGVLDTAPSPNGSAPVLATAS